MKQLFFPIIAAAILTAAQTTHSQSVPPLINYQGQVQNPDGTPLPTADYELSFRIFDAPEGGTMIWGPQMFNGQSGPGYGPRVPVVQGYFNVMLGPVDTSERALPNAFGAQVRYIEITVGSGSPIAPRQQLLSAPFALRAGDADRSTFAQKADLATNAINAATATSAINAGLATNSLNLGGIVATNVMLGLVPVGSILPFYGSVGTLPSNWRLCDGSIVSDSQSPFNGQSLPNLREMFLRGTSSGSAWPVGSTGGTDTTPAHSHFFSESDTSVFFPRVSGNGYANAYNPVTSASAFDRTLRNLTAPDGASNPYDTHGHMNGSSYISGNTWSDGDGEDNRPRFFSVNYIIRIK